MYVQLNLTTRCVIQVLNGLPNNAKMLFGTWPLPKIPAKVPDRLMLLHSEVHLTFVTDQKPWWKLLEYLNLTDGLLAFGITDFQLIQFNAKLKTLSNRKYQNMVMVLGERTKLALLGIVVYLKRYFTWIQLSFTNKIQRTVQKLGGLTLLCRGKLGLILTT